MTTPMLRLYPRAWRDRYGDEFTELLAARPPSVRDRLDIVRGALDARLHPQLDLPRAPRVAALRDRVLAAAGITTGGLFSTWAAVLVAVMPRWDDMAAASVDESMVAVSYGAGMLGALIGIAVLLGAAFRHAADMGAAGVLGASIAALGFLAMTGESGALAVVLLCAGTLLMSVGISRALGRLVAVAMVVATGFVAAAMFGFVGGNGQELLWMWMLLVYGPSWVLFGAKLRHGVHAAAWRPAPA